MSAMSGWRTLFYIIMAYTWEHQPQGPLVSPWERAFAYGHMEWVPDYLGAPTETISQLLRWGGVALAVLAVRSDLCS
jgi:hypothetical protein